MRVKYCVFRYILVYENRCSRHDGIFSFFRRTGEEGIVCALLRPTPVHHLLINAQPIYGGGLIYSLPTLTNTVVFINHFESASSFSARLFWPNESDTVTSAPSSGHDIFYFFSPSSDSPSIFSWLRSSAPSGVYRSPRCSACAPQIYCKPHFIFKVRF